MTFKKNKAGNYTFPITKIQFTSDTGMVEVIAFDSMHKVVYTLPADDNEKIVSTLGAATNALLNNAYEVWLITDELPTTDGAKVTGAVIITQDIHV
ncbi:hypothetical protein [Scandinavium goeteborgense]|uniref:hypothetical protein n=1 Tax=Scandinavium goeteborgense TaxID=1851514 RepID=UPI000F66DDA4|nr:hypothetical protein [Scandinavium goeteborgense]QKN79832.1 hypothetical protein A8O29_000465 [Scandinavium goeteborgense]